uniref:Large ribosomal subunit protein bL33m n=1 Tax=Equus asinus TaxID=9793 RepID=A0A9L0JJ34_EQUAS
GILVFLRRLWGSRRHVPVRCLLCQEQVKTLGTQLTFYTILLVPPGHRCSCLELCISIVLSTETILVKMVSQAGTGFSFNTKRSRLREKLTLLHYDPVVRKKVLFVEQKKIRSL